MSHITDPEALKDAWAARAIERKPLLANVWRGVSVEDQPTADERLPFLLQTPAAVRFVSYEPALGPVNFFSYLSGIDWVIAGGAVGPHARPSHPDWFRSVRDQCQAAGVPFFFKQIGEWVNDARQAGPYCWIAQDGRVWHDRTKMRAAMDSEVIAGGVLTMARVGKAAAGRLLDGRLWEQYPKVAA